MTTLIKRIVHPGEYGTQTVRMMVRSNERGPKGEKGDPGETATITAGQAYSVPAEQQPSVVNTGTDSAAVFDFYIPKGEKGAKGDAATVQVGSTTTLPSGYPAMVSNSGTTSEAVFNFSIPQGPKGAKGDKGDKGDTGATGAKGKDGKDGAIQYVAGTGIEITGGNVIQATGAAVATWGGIQGTMSDQTDLAQALNAKQDVLTAGDAITIDNDVISADIVPADFFTATDAVSGTGSTIALANTIEAPLKSVRLCGDANQNGTPTPSAPVDINVATREQTVTICGKNLCDSGTQSFTDYKLLTLPEPLPAGSYTFSAQVTSSDTDSTKNFVRFMNGDSGVGNGRIERSSDRTSITITTTDTANGVYIYAGYDAAGSSGDTATFTDIQIEQGSTVTAYEPYTSQPFTIGLGSIELCKIGNYQDYIYRDGNDWYIHKAVQHLSLAIADMNNTENSPGWKNLTTLTQTLGASHNGHMTQYTDCKNNIAESGGGISINTNSGANVLFLARTDWGDDHTETYWKTNYGSLVLEIYYGITTAITDTKITDTTLVGELNALASAKTYIGATNFFATATGTNLPVILDLEAYRKSLAGVLENVSGNQVQSDWTQADTTAVDYIKNKPSILQTTGTSTTNLMSQKAVTDAIAAVENGAELTSADYDWPENAPDGVALWKLETGVYRATSDIKVWFDTVEYSTTEGVFIVSTNSNDNYVKIFRIDEKSDVIYRYTTTVSDGTAGTKRWVLENNDIVDSLTSSSANKALSAKQGKVLNDKIPTITMTTTDPGEGALLPANNYAAVYGGTPLTLDYSLSEVDTGAKWVDGSAIYKKTINFGALPDTTSKSVAHGISNLSWLIKADGIAQRPADSTFFPIPYASDVGASYTISVTVNATNITVDTGMDRTGLTQSYITLYYTKSS